VPLDEGLSDHKHDRDDACNGQREQSHIGINQSAESA
jgi:hypothetical protein